jgi:hypothetical protein
MNYEWEGERESGGLGFEVLACFGTMLVAALYGAWLAVKLVGRVVAMVVGIILVML